MKLHVFIIALIIGWTNMCAQVVVRGPYLQSVAQESIKILWRTDSPAGSYVEIALEEGGAPVMTVEDTSMVEDHIVLVEGLLPATQYYYQIGMSSGSMAPGADNQYFTTSNFDGDKLSFWATGDFGSRNQKQIDVRDAFIDHVNGDYPDFWLWLGDNAYDNGTDAEYQERIFTPPYGYDQLLTFLPFYPVPGNHDYGSVNLLSPPPQHRGPYFEIVEVPKNGEAGGTPSGTELYYSFDWGNAHFVALNSEAFAYTLFTNTPMEQWLREDLSNTDKLWKIVYWHQPPYSKGSHDSDDFWEIFMAAMRQHYNPVVELFGVDLVLSGHSHVYERSHLIKGHFGKSGSFDPSTMFIDNEEPYVKYIDGDSANYGTMYIVQGNSGKDDDDAAGGHPIFAFESSGDNICGSLLVEIDGSRLTGKHIRNDGQVVDEFEIFKALRDSSVLTGSAGSRLNEFKVYPNPTRDMISLDFSLKETASILITMVDMQGREVFSDDRGSYAAGPHRINYHLNDIQLGNGQYIIRLRGLDNGSDLAFEQVIKIGGY
jgi:hypothetical protein